jgi:hypothetical protein
MGHRMRRLLPSAVELAIFATLALLCTAFVSRMNAGSHDLGFAALAGPVFLVAAVMGLRRSPVWTMSISDEASDEKSE